MVMSIEVYRRNSAWLDEKRKTMKFECRTKVKWPRPDDVTRLLSGLNIACAPLPKERVWLFDTEDAMNRFKQNYVTLDNAS